MLRRTGRRVELSLTAAAGRQDGSWRWTNPAWHGSYYVLRVGKFGGGQTMPPDLIRVWRTLIPLLHATAVGQMG